MIPSRYNHESQSFTYCNLKGGGGGGGVGGGGGGRVGISVTRGGANTFLVLKIHCLGLFSGYNFLVDFFFDRNILPRNFLGL